MERGRAMKFRSERVRIFSDGAELRLLILRPTDAAHQDGRPGVLWIHGGGYVTGMAGMVYMSRARNLAAKYGAVVVSPEYRLAGRAPYPAALIDCHHALEYLRQHAKELGVREDQLMVGGESAGGGLAAALCMYERDCGGIRIAFQIPLYPMIDNEDTETSRDNHAPVWNTRRNHYGWRRYLRGLNGGSVLCYAAPARREDYRGLPPTYSFVCTAEPFYAETLAFADHLRRAGVDAAVDVYPGLFHAFDMLLPFLRVSRRAAEKFEAAFQYAAEHCFAPQQNETEPARDHPAADE